LMNVSSEEPVIASATTAKSATGGTGRSWLVTRMPAGS
jgi:hypothetical protein